MNDTRDVTAMEKNANGKVHFGKFMFKYKWQKMAKILPYFSARANFQRIFVDEAKPADIELFPTLNKVSKSQNTHDDVN